MHVLWMKCRVSRDMISRIKGGKSRGGLHWTWRVQSYGCRGSGITHTLLGKRHLERRLGRCGEGHGESIVAITLRVMS